MRARLPHMPDDPLASPLAKVLGEALLSGSARSDRRLIEDAPFNRKLASRPVDKDRTLVEVSASAGAPINQKRNSNALVVAKTLEYPR